MLRDAISQSAKVTMGWGVIAYHNLNFFLYFISIFGHYGVTSEVEYPFQKHRILHDLKMWFLRVLGEQLLHLLHTGCATFKGACLDGAKEGEGRGTLLTLSCTDSVN